MFRVSKAYKFVDARNFVSEHSGIASSKMLDANDRTLAASIFVLACS